MRCIVCLHEGKWPEREKDVEEIDVVGEQLAQSTFVDEESRRMAIERATEIHEAAEKRGVTDDIEMQREAKGRDGERK